MAKKKSKLDLGKILTLAAMLLALAAFFFMFAPAVTSGTDTARTGAQVAFGYTAKTEVLGNTVSTKILVFSAYFIPYLLVIIGLVFSVLSLLGVLPKISKFIAVGCYIAAGVLFFLAVQMATPYVAEAITGDAKTEIIKAFRDNLTLSYGAILSGIFALMAGIASALPVFLKK